MTVVVGYVPNPEGEAAVTHAVREARARRTKLVLVNTSRGDALVDPRYAFEDQLAAIERRLVEEGVEHTSVHAITGTEPALAILEAADTHGAELIVLGVRRRSPVGKLIMGSTAQRVLLEATVPVLAVKAPRQ